MSFAPSPTAFVPMKNEVSSPQTVAAGTILAPYLVLTAFQVLLGPRKRGAKQAKCLVMFRIMPSMPTVNVGTPVVSDITNSQIAKPNQRDKSLA